jgi:hypothetical protein
VDWIHLAAGCCEQVHETSEKFLTSRVAEKLQDIIRSSLMSKCLEVISLRIRFSGQHFGESNEHSRNINAEYKDDSLLWCSAV